MEYTKKFCIIERNKDDFIIFPTKYIYFEDEEQGMLPISQAKGEVKTLLAHENGKVKEIIGIIKCSSKFVIFIVFTELNTVNF